jgi:hypothetical protein
MNPRIKKLADQCRTEYHDGHGGFVEQFDEEKFAELIVRECANFVEDKFDFIGDEIIVKERAKMIYCLPKTHYYVLAWS